jgi:hypothetical protein
VQTAEGVINTVIARFGRQRRYAVSAHDGPPCLHDHSSCRVRIERLPDLLNRSKITFEPRATVTTPDDSLYAQLLVLPRGGALILPLGITAQTAEQAIASITANHDPRRRYAIGEYIAPPREGETLHHVLIQRLPDDDAQLPPVAGH